MILVLMRMKSCRCSKLQTCSFRHMISVTMLPTGKFNIYSPVYQQQPLHACVVMKVDLAAWRGTVCSVVKRNRSCLSKILRKKQSSNWNSNLDTWGLHCTFFCSSSSKMSYCSLATAMVICNLYCSLKVMLKNMTLFFTSHEVISECLTISAVKAVMATWHTFSSVFPACSLG